MNNEKIGILSVVAKTGGIKLKENPNEWINPTREAKEQVLNNLETIKEWKGKKVSLVMSKKSGFNDYERISIIESETNEVELAKEVKKVKPSKNELITNIKGKDFVTYKGLLDLAHKKGFKGFEILDHYVSEDMKKSWCKVRGHFEGDIFFDGIGSSTPDNTGSMTNDHPVEMANTRAKARVLRDFLNVGETALEELKDRKE